jgi:hypothetical protein
VNKLQEIGFSPSIRNSKIKKFISLLSLWKLRAEFIGEMKTP